MVDKLSEAEYAKRSGYALEVIFSVPELRKMFAQAYKENWSEEKFRLEVRGTNWYKKNNEYAREAWTAYTLGGADAKAYQENARIAVQSAATQMGVRLTEKQLNQMATRYNNEGWGKSGRQQLMFTALSNELTPDPSGQMAGSSGDFQDRLEALAAANGVTFDKGFYLSAARSVNSNLSTMSDWERWVTDQAKSLYPSLADRIEGGASVKDIASSYVNTMAQTFEIDPDQISLSDPYIKQALGAVDENGNPRVMGLWEFQQKLRNDPRWMGTKQAVDEYSNTARSVLQSFGILG